MSIHWTARNRRRFFGNINRCTLVLLTLGFLKQREANRIFKAADAQREQLTPKRSRVKK